MFNLELILCKKCPAKSSPQRVGSSKNTEITQIEKRCLHKVIQLGTAKLADRSEFIKEKSSAHSHGSGPLASNDEHHPIRYIPYPHLLATVEGVAFVAVGIFKFKSCPLALRSEHWTCA